MDPKFSISRGINIFKAIHVALKLVHDVVHCSSLFFRLHNMLRELMYWIGDPGTYGEFLRRLVICLCLLPNHHSPRTHDTCPWRCWVAPACGGRSPWRPPSGSPSHSEQRSQLCVIWAKTRLCLGRISVTEFCFTIDRQLALVLASPDKRARGTPLTWAVAGEEWSHWPSGAGPHPQTGVGSRSLAVLQQCCHE
mgnify:CR=1 FL=1